jgi:hypothetical protein
MRLGWIPLIVLLAAAAIYLLQSRLSSGGADMEGPIIVLASVNFYFYLALGVTALFGLSAAKRLTWSCATPFVLFGAMALVDLVTPSSSGGFIRLDIGFRHLLGIPGIPVWNALRSAGGGLVRGVPLADAAKRNVSVRFLAAIPHRDGGLLTVAILDAVDRHQTFARLARLSAKGDTIEAESVPVPYPRVAAPQPDGSLVLLRHGSYSIDILAVEPDGSRREHRIDTVKTELFIPAGVVDVLRDREGRFLLLGDCQIGYGEVPRANVVRVLPGGALDDGYRLPVEAFRESPRAFHPLPDGGFGITFAEGESLRYDPEAAPIGPFEQPVRHSEVFSTFLERDGALLIVTDTRPPRIIRYGGGGEPDNAFNEAVRNLGQEMDGLTVLARTAAGELVVSPYKAKGRSKLVWLSPNGSVVRQREF